MHLDSLKFHNGLHRMCEQTPVWPSFGVDTHREDWRCHSPVWGLLICATSLQNLNIVEMWIHSLSTLGNRYRPSSYGIQCCLWTTIIMQDGIKYTEETILVVEWVHQQLASIIHLSLLLTNKPCELQRMIGLQLFDGRTNNSITGYFYSGLLMIDYYTSYE